MEGKIKYEFSTIMLKNNSPGGWHFISLPKIISNEIRANLKRQEAGWGRMVAHAQIDALNWDTAIWYDSKMGIYLLPIKAQIRIKGRLEIYKIIDIKIWI